MTGMITGRPAVRLRADIAAQQQRYARIDVYLERRRFRRRRELEREREAAQWERAREVPCAICGANTMPWERTGIPESIVMCRSHHQSMCGYFPLSRARMPADLPPDLHPVFNAARYALYVFNREIGREERYVQAA